MVEKRIKGEICNKIHRYAKANNKCMKDYDKNKEPSYLKYCDVNNLYGWSMLQKLPVNKFEWIEEKNIKNYNEEHDERCFLEVDVQYPKKLHELHNNLPFLPEKRKLKKIEKLVTNIYDKKMNIRNLFIFLKFIQILANHIRNLKQALNHELILKKVIKSN